MEADRAEPRALEEASEAAGEVGGVERPALRGGEDEAVVRPVRSCRLALFLLPFMVDLKELMHAVGKARRRSEAMV